MRFPRIFAPILLVFVFSIPAVAEEKPEWATLRGRVKLAKAPDRRKVDNVTDKDHCCAKGDLAYEDFVVDADGHLANVVIWLRPDSDDRKARLPTEKIHPEGLRPAVKHHVIDQPQCQFVPRVLAVRVGDTLEIKNSAPIPHNINFTSESLQFNTTIPPGKTQKASQPFGAQNSPIVFKCDMHPWMAGRIRVFDHPYYSVSDPKGMFEIKDAPVGKWRLVLWHETGFHKGNKAGPLGTTIEIKPGENELPVIELELPKS